MARRVTLEAKGPLKVGDQWLCRCGLSRHWCGPDPRPWCDGSHASTRDEPEGKVFAYDVGGLTRREVE